MDLIKQLPDDSVDCVVTSPPYWGNRDYFAEDQIGLEDHPQEYIDKMVLLLAECKRVIKPTGTIWFNVGDSFYSRSAVGSNGGRNRVEEMDGGKGKLAEAYTKVRGKYKSNWLQHKQKLMIPYRIAIQAQDQLGLIVRNDIIWAKQLVDAKTKKSIGVVYPTSVQDRLNTAHESIFMFTKTPKYFYDLDAVRVPYKTTRVSETANPKGKNPGDVIRFPYEPSKVAHLAMFPSTLPRFCIRAGCPKGGIVLEPFCGSGTTIQEAISYGCQWIGYEINKDFIDIALNRISNVQREL